MCVELCLTPELHPPCFYSASRLLTCARLLSYVPPQMPYKVVEVNPLTKGELSWSTYRKVPVCDFDGGLEIVVDSSFILSRLDAEIARANSKKEGVKKVEKTMTDEEELEWRKWVDDRFVKIITANIYRSWE